MHHFGSNEPTKIRVWRKYDRSGSDLCGDYCTIVSGISADWQNNSEFRVTRLRTLRIVAYPERSPRKGFTNWLSDFTVWIMAKSNFRVSFFWSSWVRVLRGVYLYNRKRRRESIHDFLHFPNATIPKMPPRGEWGHLSGDMRWRRHKKFLENFAVQGLAPTNW